MRILIAAENILHRKEVREFLRALPFEQSNGPSTVSITDETPSQGSIMLILSGHPKGSFYDLVVADNSLKKETSLQLCRVMEEKGAQPSIPFVIYGDKEGIGAARQLALPPTIILIEGRLTAESLKNAVEQIADTLIEAENRKRKEAIEGLMRSLASGKRITNFPVQLENIYINSAAAVQHCRKYAPWRITPYLSLAQIYVGCNKYESAIPEAKRAVQIDPGCMEAHRLLSLSYRKAGKAFEEMDELMEMLKKEPESATTLLRIGEAYLRQDDFGHAEEYFVKAINAYNPEEESRSRAKMHVGLGRAYYGQAERGGPAERIEMARNEFNAAIRIYPLLISAYNNLIIVYRKLGQYDEAIKIMGLAVDITPDNSEDWISLFEIFLIDGDPQKARFCLQKAMKYDPENQITLCTAAEIYVRQGMFMEAITLFEKAVEMNPSDSRLYNFLGICNRQLNRYEVAVGYYLNALRIAPDDPGLHYNLAMAYRHMGQRGKARAELEAALRLDAGMEEARTALDRLSREEETEPRESEQ